MTVTCNWLPIKQVSKLCTQVKCETNEGKTCESTPKTSCFWIRCVLNIRRWVKNYPHYTRVSTCFAVGYTPGWAWQNTHGLLLVYHCGAGVTLIVHFCHEFFAINMDTPNFNCTKEEQRAVIHFCGLKVYQVSKCIEWCQCSMGTVSCNNGLSVNGARG